MDLSVIIPTHARPDRLARCLASLRAQPCPAVEFEVLVGFDGPDPASERAAQAAWLAAGGACAPGPGAPALVLSSAPKRGPCAVRNRLVALSRGRVLLFLNDDVIPLPGLLAAHASAHAQAAARLGRPAMILGSAPWLVHQPDRLFDRMVRETSMVFFYNRMTDPDPWRDWGWRHAWTLNLSMPADLLRRAGGFGEFPAAYGYDDVEMAFRAARLTGAPVLFRPGAAVVHDHRMEPDEYLAREFRLGFTAWSLAHANLECAMDLFRRDITTPEEVSECERAVARDGPGLAPALRRFRSFAAIPSAAVDGPFAPELLDTCYQQHLPLKRLAWRAGLRRAAQGGPCDPDPDAWCAPPRREIPPLPGASTSRAGASTN